MEQGWAGGEARQGRQMQRELLNLPLLWATGTQSYGKFWETMCSVQLSCLNEATGSGGIGPPRPSLLGVVF